MGVYEDREQPSAGHTSRDCARGSRPILELACRRFAHMGSALPPKELYACISGRRKAFGRIHCSTCARTNRPSQESNDQEGEAGTGAVHLAFAVLSRNGAI